MQSYLDREQGVRSARAASIAARYESSLLAFVASRSELEAASLFTAQARFPAYSISKTFTAAAILRLVASGELQLDAPIGRWVPDIPHGDRITVRQCLQHTSGLPDYGDLAEYHTAVRRGERPWTFDEFLARTHAERLLFEPGHGWHYSNIGYMLLRRLIETVRGASYGAVLKGEIFDPLGLCNTAVPETPADLGDLTFGPSPYLGGDGEAKEVRSSYDPGWIPAGVVASTAAEVSIFCHSLFAGRLFPSVLLDRMCEKVPVGSAASHPMFIDPGYGLGLMIAESPCGPLYGHTGSGPGCSAAAFHFRTGRYPLTVVAFTDGEETRQAEHIAWIICSNLTAPD